MLKYCSTLTGKYISTEDHLLGTIDIYELTPVELDKLLLETSFVVWAWQSFKLSIVMNGFVSVHGHDWPLTIFAWVLNIITQVLSLLVPILPAVFIIIIYLYAYRHYVMYEEEDREFPKTFLLRVVR